jgi:transcription initiation factor TFIIB
MSDTNTRTRTPERDEETTEESTDLSCPECSGAVVADEEHGEVVCQECGLVVEEDSVDRGP